VARLVENVRRNQPFAVGLAFLDPFVRCQDFFGNFYLEHCFAAGAPHGQIRRVFHDLLLTALVSPILVG